MTEKFVTLSPSERKRTYHYSDGSNFAVANVERIYVRPSGTHRLETSDGRKWIVVPGWVAIELDVDEWTL